MSHICDPVSVGNDWGKGCCSTEALCDRRVECRKLYGNRAASAIQQLFLQRPSLLSNWAPSQCPAAFFAALISTAEPELCNYHLVHAEDDTLCDWRPSRADLHMLQQRLQYTHVAESARWMGSNTHQCWHWLHCQLPLGKVSLTDLKLSHPSVIPIRSYGSLHKACLLR